MHNLIFITNNIKYVMYIINIYIILFKRGMRWRIGWGYSPHPFFNWRIILPRSINTGVYSPQLLSLLESSPTLISSIYIYFIYIFIRVKYLYYPFKEYYA